MPESNSTINSENNKTKHPNHENKKILFGAIAAIAVTGCQTERPTAPQTTQISCRIPKIEIVTDQVNTQTQTKGGLEITLAPSLYNGHRKVYTTYKRVPPPPIALILGGGNGQKVYVEKDTTTKLIPSPARLEFEVQIHNQLDRVFHAQGAVAQFNVDGKLIPDGDADYKELANGIVPPRNSMSFKIVGPQLSLLKNTGNISFSLYDVVTATDAAGNATQKQNYTWDFTYTMQDKTDAAANTKEPEWMTGRNSAGESPASDAVEFTVP